MIPRPSSFLAVLLLLVLNISCATNPKEQELIPPGAKLTLKSIDIQAGPTANRGNVIPLDLVYVYDKEALRRLNGYTANGWFAVKKTNLIDWKGQIEWQEYQIRPGDQRTITEFPEHPAPPIALVVFARYPNTAIHRFIVVGGSDIHIQLEERGFLVGDKSPKEFNIPR